MRNLGDGDAQSTSREDSPTLAVIRRIILGLVALGTTGMTVELLLVGHFEDANQLIPLVVAAFGLVTLLWVFVTGQVVALRTFQFAMLLYAGAGAIGITLHYKANVALQLEADPTLTGVALLKKVVTAAAPPALAPGLMVQLALLGLSYTYRHPSLTATEDDS